MPAKLALVFFLSLTATSLFAQTSITLEFPSEGNRVAWTSKGLPKSVPSEAAAVNKKTDGILANAGADRVFVWDKTSGNLAIAEIQKVADKGWTLSQTSYTHVAEVTVHVESGGKPVAAAQVAIKDATRTQSQLLDPSSEGDVTFFGVKAGPVTVTVDYKSEGKAAQPVKQQFDVKLDREEVVPMLRVSLPGPVETVEEAEKQEPSSSPKEEPKANPIGTALVYFVGLGIAIAVGVLAMLYAKKNPDAVGAKLEQLGVQIPKAQDEPLSDPGPAPVPIKPAPPEKIMLGDAEPDLSSAPVPSTVVAAQPRLTGLAGAISIAEGETIVGREGAPAFGLEADGTVSRRHARIVKNGDEVKVSDLGSTNGTFVNGVQVQGEKALKPGDEVRFGTAAFRYEV